MPESSFDVNFQHSAESCFSIDSLVKNLNFKTHDEINVLEVHYSDRCKEVLQALESKSLKVKALSLLFCDLGCLNGHQQMYKENYYIKKQRYIDYINKWKKEDKFMNDSILHYEDLNLDDFDTKRSFEVYKPVVKNYSKREVWKVLNKLGKYREKHLIDCGACGYKSCWEHAVSILENKAKASMCLPFLINEYRKSLNLATLFVVSKNLQEQAITDSVTGLYNHRFFQEKLGEEIISAQERGYSFAVLFIDIDHFKKINDMYRHLAGDELLVEFSEFLTEFLEDAFLARYGGDEFVAIVSDITPYKALELGASLVNKVRKKAFRIESNRLDLNLTISVGISCYPESATDKESLISFADQALYSAKEVRNTAVLYSSDLDDLVFGRTSTRENSVNFVRILNILLNLKDNYTYQHSYRVMRYAEILARKLYFSQTDIKYLKYGAYLHDIGKINISTSILTKPGKLSSEEYEIIKQHPDLGFEIVRKIDPLANEITMSAVLYHHERYDGKGYPRGLKGKEIPIWGRIMAIADSFDAMTTDRPYKKGMRYEEAIEKIKKNAGTQFDPELAWVFGDVVKKLYKEKEFFSSNNLRKLDINGILFRKLQN